MENIKVKNIKGFSSAYPNMCNLKAFPNVDGTWVTIQDNVGTSMTIKLSDFSDFMLEVKQKPCEDDIITKYYYKGFYDGIRTAKLKESKQKLDDSQWRDSEERYGKNKS